MRELNTVDVQVVVGGDGPGLVIVPPPTYPNIPSPPWDGTFPLGPVIPPPDVGKIDP